MRRGAMQASQKMIACGRNLRRKMTVPERLIWGRLRNGRCAGLKFRRQQPFGRYVADFYCESSRVVVELDGRSHNGRWAEDVERQIFLERMGLRVIRFTNDQVLSDMNGVVKAIAFVGLRANPSPGPEGPPSPKGEG
jgi:very-short-patch-repair endonuclease